MPFNQPRFILSLTIVAMLVGCSSEPDSGSGSQPADNGPYSVASIDGSTKRIEIQDISFQFPAKFKVSYEKDEEAPSWTVNHLENGVTIREMTPSLEMDAESWAELNAELLRSEKISSCQRKLGSSSLTGSKIELQQSFIEFYDLPPSNGNNRIIEVSYGKRENKDSARLLELLESEFQMQ